MVDFAGWNMPVCYKTGQLAEHHAVRNAAGLFDVSHMGQFEIRGSDALKLVQYATCNNAKLANGKAQYSAFLTNAGTFIDDIIVYRVTDNHFLICVNAANIDKDFQSLWQLHRELQTACTVLNKSNDYFLLALQGPKAMEMLVKSGATVPEKRFGHLETVLGKIRVRLARTGYTGEDGCEIYGDPQDAVAVWNLLIGDGAVPCGLGARDTLRLESALPLYGHDIDETRTPFEAGLSWIVKMDKGDFRGRKALAAIPLDASGKTKVKKRLVGLTLETGSLPRQGFSIFSSDNQIGEVTSGSISPTLAHPIAMGYVATEFSTPDTMLDIDIRKERRHAKVVPLPFYKK